VVKFYNRYLGGSVPFIPAGTVIATFPASTLSAAGLGPAFGAVARPRLIPLPSYVPPSGGSPVVWGAALLQAGDTIYVYGTQTADPAVPNRQLYLAKVQASRLTDFAAWQFYAGVGQWATSEQNAQPVQPPGGALSVSSGFSVVEIGSRYWLTQAGVQAGSQDIDAYPAVAPWGPFDPAAGLVLFHNNEIGLDAAHDYRIMYEARAEPAVSSSRALVISYNVNSEGVTTGCVPMSAFTNTVTQPRFITVPVTAFTTAGTTDGLAAGVTSGAPGYPQIVRQDPTQWFDGWLYPGGCPRVPAVTAVRVICGFQRVISEGLAGCDPRRRPTSGATCYILDTWLAAGARLLLPSSNRALRRSAVVRLLIAVAVGLVIAVGATFLVQNVLINTVNGTATSSTQSVSPYGSR